MPVPGNFVKLNINLYYFDKLLLFFFMMNFIKSLYLQNKFKKFNFKYFLKDNLILPPSYSFKASAKASIDSISKLFVGSSYNIYKQEENYTLNA